MTKSRRTIKDIPSEAAEDNAVAITHTCEENSAYMLGRTVKGNIFISSSFGRDLFDEILSRFGKTGWNLFAERLGSFATYNICPNPEVANRADFCKPIYIEVDLSEESFKGMDLSGLCLFDVLLRRADLTGSNLTGCHLGEVTGAVFRQANLTNAQIIGDVSGADFTGAILKNVRLRQASYLKKKPPIGVSDILMKRMITFSEYGFDDEEYTRKSVLKLLKPKRTCLESLWGEMP